MRESDFYYLRTILRRLNEFRDYVDESLKAASLGGEALNDEADWLDAFIEREVRKRETMKAARRRKRMRKL